MIKVMVVVWGLVMFVPTDVRVVNGVPVAGELTVVFTNPPGQGQDHQPQMWILNAQGGLVRSDLAGDFRMRLVGGNGPGVSVQVREDFPQLGNLDAGRRASRACRTNQPECKDPNSPHDLVPSTATISGAWSTRAASVCDDFFRLPIGFYDGALFTFRETQNGPDLSPVARGFATALVLETTVPTVEGFVKLTGGDEDLIELPRALCQQWIRDFTGPTCAVLIVGNPPAVMRTCPEPVCPLHRHFGTYYDLATASSGKRWLPYVRDGEECARVRPVVELGVPLVEMEVPQAATPESGTRAVHTRPAIRCPPTFATAETGAEATPTGAELTPPAPPPPG